MKSWAVVIVVVALGVACTAAVAILDTDTECPGLYERVFKNSVPRANLSAGIYRPYKEDHDQPVTLRECVLACCGEPLCNVALLTGASDTNRCYHVTCASNDLCLPQSSSGFSGQANMVLVRLVGVEPGLSWADLLLHYTPQQRYHDAVDSLWRIADTDSSSEQHTEVDYRSDTPSELLDRIDYTTNRNYDDATMSSDVSVMTLAPKWLHVTVHSKQVQLPENNVTLVANVQEPSDSYQYEWIALQQPDGQTGAIRSQLDNRLELSHLSQGLYMFNLTVSRSGTDSISGWALANVTVLGAVRVNRAPVIVITPTNQTVRLPNTAAILDASATSDDIDAADSVQYHWELQQGPLGYQPLLPTAATLQLSDLIRPGQYTFQLTAADSEGAHSQALAYVTVLAPIDYPPTANAGPDQVLYLPLNDGELMLSGNLSTDDHDIVSWEWTRINTITINSNNNIVINNSTDTNTNNDAADNNMQAIDMRDTRTPTLRLGRIIEPGVYTFQLRVEDASNQTSTAQVRLFVKEAETVGGIRRPLAVVSGGNVTLPDGQAWVMLDGTNSTTIIMDNTQDNTDSVLYYKWDIVHIPPNATLATIAITSPQSPATNVTGLTTSGLYQFSLQVSASSFNNNNSTSTGVSTALMNVTARNAAVTSRGNKKPPRAFAVIADGSGNGNTVQLPRNAIYLNASQSRSTDDSAIVSYKWRSCIDYSPLTVLSVAEDTDQHPVLVLVLRDGVLNVEEPLYLCWNVTVQDSDGLTDWQEVRFTVLPDVMLAYLVQVIIETPKNITTTNYNNLIDSLQSLSSSSISIHVRSGNIGYSANTALFVIYATPTQANNNNNETTAGVAYISAEGLIYNIQLEQTEQQKQQQQLPQHRIVSIRPVSCHSVRCSGHGHCDPHTRTCHCHSLWMPSLLSLLRGSSSADYTDYDCSWSVLYVTLATVFSVAVSVVLCCRYCCCCGGSCRGQLVGSSQEQVKHQQKQRSYHQTKRSRGSRNHSYTLIDAGKRGKLTEDSDDSDRVGSADSDDNVVFNSLNNKLMPNNAALLGNNINKLSLNT